MRAGRSGKVLAAAGLALYALRVKGKQGSCENFHGPPRYQHDPCQDVVENCKGLVSRRCARNFGGSACLHSPGTP